MCGIAGLLRWDGTPVSAKLLRTLGDSMVHRGPDDLGYLGWRDGTQTRVSRDPAQAEGGRLALVHRRLSILDPSDTGWQPMSSPDEKYHIVFNGEIYNFIELKAELERLGHRFRSTGDTEVLLHAYMEWGEAALRRFVGMFAFAILDLQRQELFLARDFFGIKPLHFAVWDTGMAFASEPKTLLQVPGVTRKVNPQLLYGYLSYGHAEREEQTFFADIRQLQPAHYLEIPLDKGRKIRPVKYWQVDRSHRSGLSLAEAASRFRDLFFDNVRLHLRSDVPVAATLSGGIDSSSIVMAARRARGSPLDLHTFSYIADEERISEERWIDIVGQAAATTAHKVRADAEGLHREIDHLIYMQDEPVGTSTVFAQFRVFRAVKEAGIKVVLDGQGADELLAGYYHFLPKRLASLLARRRRVAAIRFALHATRLPGVPQLREFIKKGRELSVLGSPAAGPRGATEQPVRPGRTVPWVNGEWFAERGVLEPRIPLPGGKNCLRDQLYLSFFDYGLPHLLRVEDRNSMAFSVESRLPFLTPEFVQFAFSLPEAYLIDSQATTKAILRRAMRGVVPDEVLDRRDKIGFWTPEERWLMELRPWIEDLLGGDAASRIPALNLKVMLEDWESFLGGRAPVDHRIWRWINLIRWTEMFEVSYEG
ncbi:MAG: asparagine synthase (glutamine-hydrolyzing) [Armatimonadetes bacterium]|nr:asparagine synthase (glutamine-hydrolyzing) [Armatimonadota bacterium]